MNEPTLDQHALRGAGPRPEVQRAGTRGQPIGANLEWRQSLGGALIGLGAVALLIGWWGISGETEPWKQFPYLASGGIGGASLIALGITLLISFEHARDRAALGAVLERIDDLEARIDDSAKAADERANGKVTSTPSARRRSPAR
jgi:hypothetical protein